MPPEHGCVLLPGLVPEHEAVMGRLLAELSWTSHMRSRRTASMGVPYDYANNQYDPAPWHPLVRELAERLPLGFEATNCLLNHYPGGEHGVRFHADDTSILQEGTGVAILSLGATRPLRLRAATEQGFHYEDLSLPGGSLLLMPAAMQADWRHALRPCAGAGARMSLSFRRIVRWRGS